MNLKQYLINQSRHVNKALKKYLPSDNSLISRAMRYSMFAGGKRLRPMLVLEANKICGGSAAAAMPAACSVEYIHTYSLIHDDLPAMDDDDLRRGMPTCHKTFGEAAAILAGDALLTEAFGILATANAKKERVIRSIMLLSEAAGYKGMIGGQMRDTLETASWENKTRNRNIADLKYIHENKTGALIKASLLMGAVLAGAGEKDLKRFSVYGSNIGVAFQIADDILDVTADKKLLGKNGSDKDNNKLTFTAVHGIDGSRKKAQALIDEAKDSIKVYGRKADMLFKLADYMIERKY